MIAMAMAPFPSHPMDCPHLVAACLLFHHEVHEPVVLVASVGYMALVKTAGQAVQATRWLGYVTLMSTEAVEVSEVQSAVLYSVSYVRWLASWKMTTHLYQ